MNAERLHALIIELSNEYKKLGVVSLVQNLTSTLENVVANPHPSHQQSLANSLSAVKTKLSGTSSDSFSPAWRQILQDIGGEGLVGSSLRNAIEGILARNQITPAVALDELKALVLRVTAFAGDIEKTISSFEHFGIGHEVLVYCVLNSLTYRLGAV